MNTRLAVVGGGWAGLATAVRATELGWQVSVFEAARHWGGRARALPTPEADNAAALDNGQHILIGAYSATLGLLERLGVDLPAALTPLPLDLRFADGGGLAVPRWAARWPQPLDLLAAITGARGWSWRERFALLHASLRWRAAGFTCAPELSVGGLCARLPARVIAELIEPLCLSALNTPLEQASAEVFLRVLRDALFGQGHGPWRGADLLLPRVDLGELLPGPALRWLRGRGAAIQSGKRIESLQRTATGWHLQEQDFDAVVLACPPREAARLVRSVLASNTSPDKPAMQWMRQAEALEYEAIATIYARAFDPHTGAPADLPDGRAMLGLRSGALAPAQFVFDRGRLGGPRGLLAFVVSASGTDRLELERQVLAQGRSQLGLSGLEPLQTVIEKRATFACTPGLHRPAAAILPGLWAAGDHVAGPYPATLEAAVRSGLWTAEQLRPLAAPRQGPSKD